MTTATKQAQRITRITLDEALLNAKHCGASSMTLSLKEVEALLDVRDDYNAAWRQIVRAGTLRQPSLSGSVSRLVDAYLPRVAEIAARAALKASS